MSISLVAKIQGKLKCNVHNTWLGAGTLIQCLCEMVPDGCPEEQEFHDAERWMVTPALFHFVFNVLQSSTISVLGCEFTDYTIWF